MGAWLDRFADSCDRVLDREREICRRAEAGDLAAMRHVITVCLVIIATPIGIISGVATWLIL
jgi:hypothetical protein